MAIVLNIDLLKSEGRYADFHTTVLKGPANFFIYIDIWRVKCFKTGLPEWFGKASISEYTRPASKEITIVSHHYISSLEEVKKLVINGINDFFSFQWQPITPP